MHAAKRVVCYLKGSAHLGLTYDRRTIGQVYEGLETPAPFGLIVYADSNIAGDPEDRKSTMGYCFFIGGALASLALKRNPEAENRTMQIAVQHLYP